MKQIKKTLAIVSIMVTGTAMAEVVGEVITTFRMLGKNDAVVVESIKDPDIQGVTCHISYAKVGGLSGTVGLAEDPSQFSLSCRQTGALIINKNIDNTTKVTAFDRNAFFKEMIVTRMYDKPNNTLIYLITSKKLMEGSHFNAISSIPMMPWGITEPVFK